MTTDERLLLGYLHHHCRGAGRARTYARLREDMAAVGRAVSERAMYDLIAALVLKRRPVATTGTGAYIYQTPRDVRIGLRNLLGRVLKQLRRIRVYKATAREEMTRQRYLDLTDAETAWRDAVARVAGPPAGADALGQGQLFGALTPGARV